jgi:peptide/nickel transport system permease protein
MNTCCVSKGIEDGIASPCIVRRAARIRFGVLRHDIQLRGAACRNPGEKAIGLFLLKRLVTFVLTLLAASAVIFAVLDVLPGNAAELQLGESATPEAVQALRLKLGLDRPPLERYTGWIGGALHGDLGRSVSYDTPVAGLVAERLAVTLPLALMAMTLTSVLALALGIYAASRHNKAGDVGVMALSQLGIALPNFWFGILLILLFSVRLRWFSAGGFPGWEDGVWDGVKALALPAVALAAVQAAILARITRSAVLDVLREDFVRTARAKGLSPRQTLWRHVLRNAFVPVLTVMGLQFANLIAGTVVIENVFSLPGLGRLVFQAIANRDLLVVRNVVMLLAATVIVINFVVDVLYAVIDPRLRLHSA